MFILQRFTCCASEEAEQTCVPPNLHDMEAESIIQLARTRLDHLLEKKSVPHEVKVVRDLLVAAKEKLHESTDVADGRGKETSLPAWLAARRPSYESRQSHKQSRQGSVLSSAGETAEAIEWIQETFTRVDAQAANISSSRAAQREQNALQTKISSGEISSRLANVNMQELTLALESDEVSKHLQQVRTLDFDSVAFTEIPVIHSHPLCPLGAQLVTGKGLIWALSESGRIQDQADFRSKYLHFFHELDLLYKDVPYHNVAHAADVLNTIGWFNVMDYYAKRMSALDRVLSMASAAMHDVAHPGVTNAFLEKARADLALRYNDKSILENMHVSLGFETMARSKSCDWFSLLPQEYQDPEEQGAAPVDLQRYARKLIIEMVLSTDMVTHSHCVNDLADLASAAREDDESEGDEATKWSELDHKMFMMKTALHAADISNPCKPRQIMLQWTDRINLEFWAMGDKERSMGLSISPLCDRESGMKSVPKNQLGFIQFVIRPLYAPLAQIIPEASEALKILDDNVKFWKELDEKQATYSDIFEKVITTSG